MTSDGVVVQNMTLGAPDAKLVRDVIAARKGEAVTSRGRTRFAVHAVGVVAGAAAARRVRAAAERAEAARRRSSPRCSR